MENMLQTYSLEEVRQIILKNIPEEKKEFTKCKYSITEEKVWFFVSIHDGASALMFEKYEKNGIIYFVSFISLDKEMIREVLPYKGITSYGKFSYLDVTNDLNEISKKIETSYQNGDMDEELFEKCQKRMKEQRLCELLK